MFAMAVQTQSVWMQVVGSALLGLLGISWCSVMGRRAGVAVRVHGPTELVVGAAFEIQVVVHNSGRQPTAPLRIRHELVAEHALVAPAVIYIDPVPPRDTTVVSVRGVPLRRGKAHTRLVVDAIGSFGFFTSTRQVDSPNAVFAAPFGAPPVDLARALSADIGGAGPIGPGLDVRGVREWRPGDAVRHVHWRSTARTGRLAVLEYGEPMVDKVGVFITGTTAQPRFEAELAIAASTTLRAFDDGIRVVLALEDVHGKARLLTSARTDTPGRPMTPLVWHRMFAVLRAVPPEPSLVDGMLASVGFGGIVLLARGDVLPFGFLSYLESAARVAGVRVLYVADYLDGRR
jgi:uncharacterized protein (DUF58 family)